jgi:hypothetical protein
MFFEKFPLLFYTLDDSKTIQTVPDILRRVVFSDELKKNSSFFDQYDIKDGETPEIIADYWYGNSNLHWIILLANDIIDPRFDWPLSYNNLVEFCKGKYGKENIYKLHHYANANDYVINGYRSMIEGSTFDNPISLAMQSSSLFVQVNLVSQDFPVGSLFPVSNIMYEIAENEKKRRINIVKPSIVSTIESNFESIISQ